MENWGSWVLFIRSYFLNDPSFIEWRVISHMVAFKFIFSDLQ